MPQTKRGYDFNELLSALQKDIRRGKEYEALFWAVELESFNPKVLWSYLRVIASEDIGIAQPFLTLLIETLQRQYEEATKEGYRRLYLAHAVTALVKSEKSRLVVDLANVVNLEIKNENKKLRIPDYALDRHTLKGKQKGRGWKHFFAVGSELVNETKKFPNAYKKRAEELVSKYEK
jgi:replication-associated recombination protein RarA